MGKIQEKLKELYYQSDKCIRCGRCTTVCPTFAVSKKEPMVARGRVRLAREYLEGKLELTGKLKLYFDLCLGCDACLEICPPGIRTAEFINLVKIDLAQKSGSPVLDTLLLNRVLHSPASLREKLAWLGLARKLGVTKLFPPKLREAEQRVPEIPGQSLQELLRKQGQVIARQKYRVGYFIGCLTGALFPEIARDTVRVLEHHECEVIVPENTVCCGLPHRNTGLVEEARRLAKQNIEAFSSHDLDYVVTDCGTCGCALKNYESYFDAREEAEAARNFSQRVYDIHAFLVDVIGLKPGEKVSREFSVTYHDACHLSRGQQVVAQPRAILTSIPGATYVELPQANRCCGGAGSFSMKHSEVSLKILETKMRCIEATKAQYVTAGCPACLMQLHYGTKIFGLEVHVKHPVQLLAASI